jgi:hypothetical protein
MFIQITVHGLGPQTGITFSRPYPSESDIL